MDYTATWGHVQSNAVAGSVVSYWKNGGEMIRGTVRVLIADDHPGFRESLRGLLASEGMDVVGEAATGDQALQLAVACRPDLVILDLRMPLSNGIAVASQILASLPDVSVVTLSLSYNKQYVISALEAGVRGYIAKGDALNSLVEAIETVRAGGHFLSPLVTLELRNSAPSAFSLDAERAFLAWFDRDASTLFRCARAAASSEEWAAAALSHSFSAYLMARDVAGGVRNARAWLVASLVSFLFDVSGAAPQPPAERGGAGRRARWWCSQRRSHARPGEFSGYWAGAMSGSSRARWMEHLRGCPSCCFQWSLAAFAEPSRDGPHQRASEPEERVLDIRKKLVRELHAADVGGWVIAWVEREARAQKMLASEMEALLGPVAARGWKQVELSPAKPRPSPLAWTGEFLGSKAARLVAVGLENPSL